MMNPQLVAELESIANEQRNGSLVLGLGSRKVRFGFEQGELVLLDLGEEKEVSMARKLLDYHKIGPEIHRHALNTARATGASIVETLRRQQLVGENEIDMVAQAMVEDLLALVFSLANTDLSFTEDGVDTYDLDKRAVRLRIDVPSLVHGVQARLDEEGAVMAEIGGFNTVYALDEGADPDQLDEFERHLLTMVDGRKTVENLAVAFRDSSINMARFLVILMHKGALKRAGGMSDMRAAVSSTIKANSSGAYRDLTNSSNASNSTTTARAPSTAGASGAPEADGGPTPPGQFEVYRPPREQGNLGVRLALGSVLIVVVAIGWMVVSYGSEKSKVDNELNAIQTQINANRWHEAEGAIAAAQSVHGGDLTVVRRLKEFSDQIVADQNAAIDTVAALIAAGRLDEARKALDVIPADVSRRGEVQRELDDTQKEFDDRFALLDRMVKERLDQGQISEALALADKEKGAVGEALGVTIDRWRLTTVEQASMNSAPMGRRQQLLNQVQLARPTDAQKDRINSLQEELLRYQARRKEQLILVSQMVDKGDWIGGEKAITDQRLLDQAPGSELEAQAKALVLRIETLGKNLTDLVPAVRSSVTNAVDLKSLGESASRLRSALETYPDASNRADLEQLAALINALQPILSSATVTDEIIGLEKLAASTNEPDIAKALLARIETLRRTQDEANGALERARALIREGNWELGLAGLDRIRTSRDWSRTIVGQHIDEVIAQAKLDQEKQLALDGTFRDALKQGDIAKAYSLARELGRPYLPLLIESVPAGAQVLSDGKKIGSTPLILEISAADRVDMTFELHAEGYETRTVQGTEATGGWRLTIDLKREPAITFALGEIVTSQIGVDGTHVWMANNRIIANVDTVAGTFTTNGYGSTVANTDGSLERPIYAPPKRVDGLMLASTRDGFVLQIADNGTTTRLPVSIGSDFAPIIHRSQVILDRLYIILAGLNGQLVANDPRSTAGWKSPVGEPFVVSPVLIDERVFAVRRDGTLFICQVDRGELLASVSVGKTVIAAWGVEDGVAGYTTTSVFHWNGKDLKITALPREISAGSKGIIITREQQVLIEAENGEWNLLGSTSKRVNGIPIRWGNRAVIPEGDELEVLGAGGFRLRTKAAFLNPVIAGDRLVVVATDGEVRVYNPR